MSPSCWCQLSLPQRGVRQILDHSNLPTSFSSLVPVGLFLLVRQEVCTRDKGIVDFLLVPNYEPNEQAHRACTSGTSRSLLERRVVSQSTRDRCGRGQLLQCLPGPPLTDEEEHGGRNRQAPPNFDSDGSLAILREKKLPLQRKPPLLEVTTKWAEGSRWKFRENACCSCSRQLLAAQKTTTTSRSLWFMIGQTGSTSDRRGRPQRWTPKLLELPAPTRVSGRSREAAPPDFNG